MAQRHKKFVGAGVVVFLLLLPLPQRADAGIRFEHSLQVMEEYDDNVRREEKGEIQDLLLRFLYRAEGGIRFDARQSLSFRLQVGGKKYLSLLDRQGLEGDALIGKGEGSWQRFLTDKVGLKADLSLQGRLIRDFAERSFENNGNLGLFFLLPQEFDLALSGGYLFFDYNDTTVERFHFVGDRYLLSLARPLGASFATGVAYAFQRRFFSFEAVTLREPEGEGFDTIVFDPLGESRRDLIHEVTLYLQYARRIVLRVGYTFQRDGSNSYRGDFVNHRIQVNFSKRIFAGFTFLALGKFQFKVYDDPAVVMRTIAIDGDTEEPTEVLQRFENQNENLSSLEVKLVHPVGKDLSLDLKYGFFFLLQEGENTYLRNIVGIGLRKRF
ncbi:MAG: hypothetical protein D6812_03560 [Deltaproteobacteria bacterium]|nr:MAG: hypothetical protein D6812_03560 [Deltaproteobacteria bacterium]